MLVQGGFMRYEPLFQVNLGEDFFDAIHCGYQ